jgi:hypothetical protein
VVGAKKLEIPLEKLDCTGGTRKAGAFRSGEGRKW